MPAKQPLKAFIFPILLKLEEIFLRVIDNLKRETDGYLDVMQQMHVFTMTAM